MVTVVFGGTAHASAMNVHDWSLPDSANAMRPVSDVISGAHREAGRRPLGYRLWDDGAVLHCNMRFGADGSGPDPLCSHESVTSGAVSIASVDPRRAQSVEVGIAGT